MADQQEMTMFSFGYYGWGNSTPQLIEAADTIERSRGFRPPIFVDIRIRRTVRAVGFSGTAFQDLLGDKRHRWMRSLGNQSIITRSGTGIQIADPKAADELLDLAIEVARDKRRVVFFCGCQWPRIQGKVNCHRTVVANLVLAAARRQGTSVEIVEWPGEKAGHLEFEVDPVLFRLVCKGRMTVPLPRSVKLKDLGGPPWGSIATFRHDGHEVHRLVGPVCWHKEQWCLPVSLLFFDADVGLPLYRKESLRLIKSNGLGPRTSLAK